jgi:uncharacterized tellurite resistance protein B-like protein
MHFSADNLIEIDAQTVQDERVENCAACGRLRLNFTWGSAMSLRNILDYLAPRPATSARVATTATSNFRWAGRGSEVRAGLFHLLDPLVYVFDSRRSPCEEPSAIDLALPIGSVAVQPATRELPYWPNYQILQPHQRRHYLQWLAGNRTSVPSELGYTFLFFYNLERRALVDRGDARLIFTEVNRLRRLYVGSGQPASGSWENYSGRFLWALLLAHTEALTRDDLRAHLLATKGWSDDTLASALACLLARGCRLTASIAFPLAAALPQSLRSIVQRRVPQEFEDLFKKRFREQYPDGMEVRPSAAKRLIVYRPASNVLPPLEISFNDPLGARSQFKPLSTIWNACTEDLKKLGTLSKWGTDLDAVKRWEAMPDELRAGADHPLTDEFCKLVDARADENGQTVIKADDLAAVLDPEGPAKLTLIRSRRLCQTAEGIGYFLEPDARLTGRAYKPGEQVIAFLKLSTAPVDPGRYGPAACMLQFGFLVAAADGAADARELGVISQHIEAAFELQEDEVRRLERLRVLLQQTGPDKPLLRRLVRNLGKLQRQAIAKLLVAIIMADGVVTAQERKALKAACTLLTVDFTQVERLLPQDSTSDEPVTVVPAKPGTPGERLPAPPEQKFTLDKTAIAAILAETRDVAQMLAKAMATADDGEAGEEDVPDAAPATVAAQAVAAVASPLPATAAAATTAGPEAKYQPLHVALIARDRWPIGEAETLARGHGLMLAGAIDAINEWAAEACGGPLYYEEEGFLVVERSLL